MRELTLNEIEGVSGGFDWGTGSNGIFSPTNFSSASRFAGGVGLVYGSFRAGYSVGTWAYNNFISDWLWN